MDLLTSSIFIFIIVFAPIKYFYLMVVVDQNVKNIIHLYNVYIIYKYIYIYIYKLYLLNEDYARLKTLSVLLKQ